MMHPSPEQEAIAKIQGLKPYFTAGPQPADRKLFLGFSLLTVLRPFNSVLLHLSSVSFLLGMVAYVYGDALAMVAPALCLVWLRVNLVVFRQPVHYLIFLAAYGASLVSITISSIVWMALMANIDNIAKHRTVAQVYANDRYFVVVVWFMLQLLIAVLGSMLLYLVFLAYKAQTAACSAQSGSSADGNMEAGLHQSRPVELSAMGLDASQDHSTHRQQGHYVRRQHSRGRDHEHQSDHHRDAANAQYDRVYDEDNDRRTSRQIVRNERFHDSEDGVGGVPQEAEAGTRPSQKPEKGFLKIVKTGIAAAKVAEDATRLGRSIEKTAKARQSGNARPEKEAEAAFEQVSAAGKLTQDSAKLARMTKQTKVNEVRTAENQEYAFLFVKGRRAMLEQGTKGFMLRKHRWTNKATLAVLGKSITKSDAILPRQECAVMKMMAT
ncbi:hypothetical protein AAVH_12929 [Aphelenchoides avenae]|nr:hypothetical protein AAVH_12929 [Aphelenchus avenae]